MQEIMSRKITTGAHLLTDYDRKSQFGAISASCTIPEGKEKVEISLRRADLKDLSIDDDFITFEIDFKQLEIVARISTRVHEQIGILAILAARNKLSENAYLEE